MRKIVILFLMSLLSFSFTGCSQAEETISSESEDFVDMSEEIEKSESQTENGNILIVYFSMMETEATDTVAGASRILLGGENIANNQYIAQIIQEETNGELFPLRTVQQYPTTHEPLLEFAESEREEKARPKLVSLPENLDDIEYIFIGFPIWYADLPMPLYSFFEETDLSGKTIIPFTVHGGSGFASTIQTITNLQEDADVITDGFSVSRNNVINAKEEVIEWLKQFDFIHE